MTILLIFLVYAAALSLALSRAGHHSRVPGASDAAMTQPERILIIGATGGTGRALVAEALERGLHVTALARNPSDLRLDNSRLRVVQGDVLDLQSIVKAMPGQQAVLSALGHKRFFYPTRILSEGTRNILAAMDGQGVKRFLCETSLGIGDSAGRMGLYYTFFVIPLILPLYFWDKTRQERIIAQSNAEWTIVRPAALNNGKPRGQYHHGRIAGNFLTTARISRADVASFMLDQLSSPDYLRTACGVSW